mgnify:CR=1 FL=1|jgi:hypothetical protein|tara:strand:+ start:1496 stop:1708 length:213 start_codon:yes stop_codon:yes gene_type:complete
MSKLNENETVRQTEQEIMYRTFDDKFYKLIDKYCDITSKPIGDEIMSDYYLVMNKAFDLIMKARKENTLL